MQNLMVGHRGILNADRGGHAVEVVLNEIAVDVAVVAELAKPPLYTRLEGMAAGHIRRTRADDVLGRENAVGGSRHAVVRLGRLQIVLPDVRVPGG